jgi:hypothetical protein
MTLCITRPPDNVQPITLLALLATPRIAVHGRLPDLIKPEPIIPPVAINIFKSNPVNISHSFAREAFAKWLPVFGYIVNPPIAPAPDVSVILEHAVIRSPIAIHIGKADSTLRVTFRVFDLPNLTEGRWPAS